MSEEKGSQGTNDPRDGGYQPNRGCVGSKMSIGGGHPNSKEPTLSLKKFSMMVLLFRSMMALTMVAWQGWFMKASISMEEPISFGVCNGGFGGIMETMGYG